jgi:hypothetical protein
MDLLSGDQIGSYLVVLREILSMEDSMRGERVPVYLEKILEVVDSNNEYPDFTGTFLVLTVH